VAVRTRIEPQEDTARPADRDLTLRVAKASAAALAVAALFFALWKVRGVIVLLLGHQPPAERAPRRSRHRQ
jgi:hypothetical protein